MKAIQHFCTITHHKMLVLRYCFRVGLYRQGLFHDLSKYTWTEFRVGCRYYQGDQSPNNAERKDIGYSSAWLHHKGRNKHHYEYWIDYNIEGGFPLAGMKMPVKYVVEMVMDRIAASRTYMGETYTDAAPLAYFERGKGHYVIHPETERLLEALLRMLADCGEEKTFAYIRQHVLKNKAGRMSEKQIEQVEEE